MLTISLFSVFVLVALVIVAIGVFSKVPVITGSGALVLALIALAVISYGITEYDGTFSQTTTYSYLDAANTSIDNTVAIQTANIETHDDMFVTYGLGTFLLLCSIGIFYYAVDLVRNSAVASNKGKRDVEEFF